MPSTTPKGQLSYPLANDPNNVPADIQTLVTRLDNILGVETFTTTQRDALAAAQRWDGRVIWNSTLRTHQGWDNNVGQWVSIGGGGSSLQRTFMLMGA